MLVKLLLFLLLFVIIFIPILKLVKLLYKYIDFDLGFKELDVINEKISIQEKELDNEIDSRLNELSDKEKCLTELKNKRSKVK